MAANAADNLRRLLLIRSKALAKDETVAYTLSELSASDEDVYSYTRGSESEGDQSNEPIEATTASHESAVIEDPFVSPVAGSNEANTVATPSETEPVVAAPVVTSETNASDRDTSCEPVNPYFDRANFASPVPSEHNSHTSHDDRVSVKSEDNDSNGDFYASDDLGASVETAIAIVSSEDEEDSDEEEEDNVEEGEDPRTVGDRFVLRFPSYASSPPGRRRVGSFGPCWQQRRTS